MTKRTYIRYAVSFAFLTAMLILLLFWNINSGSVHLSAGEIGKILTDQTGDSTAYHIVWDIRLPRILAVVILGGALSVSGFLLQTFFASHCRSLCAGYLFRRQTGGIPADDLHAGKGDVRQLRCHDPGSLCRRHDLHGFCPSYIRQGKEDVHAGHMRGDDRLYLFRHNGFCGNLC